MRWIEWGACNHSICICVRGGGRHLIPSRGECNATTSVWFPKAPPPHPRRLRNHLRVVTSTHVCIVADIIVHNHEMMMSWCAQSRWMLGATLLFILLLFEARFVGAWLLEKKKSRQILPNIFSFLLARTMRNPLHGGKAYFTPIHTYASSGID